MESWRRLLLSRQRRAYRRALLMKMVIEGKYRGSVELIEWEDGEIRPADSLLVVALHHLALSYGDEEISTAGMSRSFGSEEHLKNPDSVIWLLNQLMKSAKVTREGFPKFSKDAIY